MASTLGTGAGSTLSNTLKIAVWITFIVLLGENTAKVDACGRSRVYLLNNEYHNIVIAINENVPENPELLDRIKEIFTDASAFLYRATRYRAFFKEISILVPKSWKDNPEYRKPEFESYDMSDVIIDYPDEEAGTGNRPFVINPTPCGQLGQYMHLTPQYVLDPAVASYYGPHDKVIVHEWAHLRWGVYDEYPDPLNGQHFYAGVDGVIEATRCSATIKGRRITLNGEACEIGDNNLPEADCRFLDDRREDGYTGSLMYKQFLPNMMHFCDNETFAESSGDLHNRAAPNKQNRMCDGMSIWEVLREHDDFKDGANEPRELGVTTPDFHIVKQTNKRTVLVMDISGSMEANDRIEKLGQAVSHYILNTVDDEEMVGIVVFSDSAIIKSPLVNINNDTRSSLLSHIPTRDDIQGWTSIGSGLVKGLEVLEDGDQDAAGGVILVVTDGEENRNPTIEDVMPTLISKNVTVDSIAFGIDASDNLETLPAATDGRAFFYSEGTNSNALNEAFTTSAQRDKSVVERPIQLYSDMIMMTQNYTFEVYIDSTIGKKTEFTLDYLGRRSIEVSLTQPDGAVIDSQSEGYELDETFKVVRINIPGEAQVGKWSVLIKNRQANAQSVSINVQSRSRRADVYPILVTSQWSNQVVTPPSKQILYVSVSKGYTPLLNAEVMATVERPNNEPVELMMLDNGAGADVTQDDGIYTSYFTEFSGSDRYSVKVTVNNKDGRTVVSPSRIIGVGALNDPTQDLPSAAPNTPAGDFQRVTSGGSFTCEGSACEADSGTDLYPPAKIVDVVVSRVSYESKQVTLQFTATGDDLDQGKASSYEIWMDIRFEAMYFGYERTTKLTQAVMKMGILTAPKQAGSVEFFTFEVPSRGEMSFYFVVVAVDDADNKSPRSNIVSVSMRDFSESNLPFSIPVFTAIVAAGVALLLVIIIFLLICCKCCCCTDGKKSDAKKQKKRKQKAKEKKKVKNDKVAIVDESKSEPISHTNEVVTTDEVVIVYNTSSQAPSQQNGHAATNQHIAITAPEPIYTDVEEPKPNNKIIVAPAVDGKVIYHVPTKQGNVSNLKSRFEK